MAVAPVMRTFNTGLTGINIPGARRLAEFVANPPDLPVKTGLRGLYVFLRSPQVSCRNYVEGGPNATIIGSPAVHESGIGLVMDKLNCLDTGLDITPAASYMGISRKIATDGTTKLALIGNYQPTGIIGDMVALDTGRLYNYSGRAPDNASDNIWLNYDRVPVGDEFIWGATASPGTPGVQDLYYSHAGTITDAVNETQASRRPDPTGRTLKLGGSNHPSAYNAATRHVMAVIYGITLTAAQYALNEACLREWALSLDVTTL